MALIYTLTLLEGTPLRDRPEGRPNLSGGLGPPSLQSCTSLTGQGSGLLSAAFYESWRHAEDNRCVLGTSLLSILNLSRGSQLPGLLSQSDETL